MAELTTDNFTALFAGLADKANDLSRCLSNVFDDDIRLEGTVTGKFTGECPIVGGEGPGLIIALRRGRQGLMIAIPQTLPLPAWYADPSENDSGRLQILAEQCSKSLLPDGEADEFAAVGVKNLADAIAASLPAPTAQTVVFERIRDSADHPAENLCIIGPVTMPPVPSLASPARRESTTSGDTRTKRTPSAEMRKDSTAQATREMAKRLTPLLTLPVQVVVMLAEKKIELGQLLALSPGSLITFDKPCDSLLDLYVNNQIYCRGEAIKIGEHFGLKVNEVRPRPTRPKKVL